MEPQKCEKPDCDIMFVKKTHNQKYCSKECCRIITNQKIMERYHLNSAIKKGKRRNCKKCSAQLSRYNKTNKCSLCSIKKKDGDKDNLSSILAIIT